MNNLEQLFVRACKAKNPLLRISSVYRRFYCANDEMEETTIIIKLAEICDKYNLITTIDLISNLNPNGYNNYISEYNERAVTVLMNAIRFAHKVRFPFLIIPARFRYK